MDPKLIILFKLLTLVHSIIINDINNNTDVLIDKNNNINSIFNGVYSECFMHLSYMCLQKKTLLYLKELNSLSEVSVFGDYVKFVKLNTTNNEERSEEEAAHNTEELAFMIDRAVDKFFDNHVLKFNALGKDIIMPRNVEEFVGRKKRKGGGGGGGHMSEDGGKKKMMMMAMMCMKMKLMMMVPAMMGMMGMMSFKGMMFSMMSFMLSKMMLLMKILEKKGGSGLGGGGSGGGDGGWMAASGGGGAWMPAGGQDFGGGGYDANGQWQSRSIVDNISKHKENKPTITYVKPVVRYSNGETNQFYKTPVLIYKKSNVNFDFDKKPANSIDQIDKKNSEVLRKKRDVENVFMESSVADDKQENREEGITNDNDHETNSKVNDNFSNINYKSSETFYTEFDNEENKLKSRTKRGILDLLQNSYVYWMNKFLGLNNNRRTAFQRYKVVNGVKYVYYPYPFKVQKQKTPKDINLNNNENNDMKANDELKPVIAAEDFNKGEIMEGSVQSRMMKKKFTKMKDTVNEAMEDNPWE